MYVCGYVGMFVYVKQFMYERTLYYLCASGARFCVNIHSSVCEHPLQSYVEL